MRWMDRIESMQNTCVAYGEFDGLHKGHLAVIKTLVKESKKRGCKSVLLSRSLSEGVLTTEEEKAYLLEKNGLDVLISDVSGGENVPAEEFIKEVLIKKLGACTIVAGSNCRDLEVLKNSPVPLTLVETVRHQGEELTRELVKKSLLKCELQEVGRMCGHPYVIMGTVVHGKALGRTVGMPTANLKVPGKKLKPPSGVYATTTETEKEVCQGLTNIGTRPTVDDLPSITIETFLLDFDKEIYGSRLITEVHQYIRGIQKFNSLEEVQNQVLKDLAQVKDYLDAL